VPRRRPTGSRAADLTAPAEDYLKVIYEIERSGAAAGTNDIAGQLEIAPASVSGMIRRLANQGLVKHERYHGVRLTPAGRSAALRTLRRHRILECYLTQILGYQWDRVHDEAERLEHTASDELIDRMAKALGDPTVDPHGAPIPTRDGTVDERRHRSLADLVVGDRARVVRMADEDGDFLRYLGDLGITPGADVEVSARAPFDGPLTVKIGRATHAVGSAAAARVYVRRREDEKTRRREDETRGRRDKT
jgi:DtxR family Mn-dependent transcriptional regulator